jgi:hypothetical protein
MEIQAFGYLGLEASNLHDWINPIQVIEGNYQRMGGVCLWRDGTARQGALEFSQNKRCRCPVPCGHSHWSP